MALGGVGARDPLEAEGLGMGGGYVGTVGFHFFE